MSKYERSGKARVPQWWLDRVLPILNSRNIRYEDLAREASRHAGRSSPWRGDAISKFASGEVRTIELTNGISAALGVVQPFFTAPTEATASAFNLALKRAQDHEDKTRHPDQDQLLSVTDELADEAIRRGVVDVKRSAAVLSSDHGDKSGRGGRARRSGRGRT